MKFLRVIAILLAAGIIMTGLSSSLMAADGTKGAQDSANLEQLKARLTANFDARIKMLQDERSCVSAATSREDLRKCRQSAREEILKMKKEMMEQRKGAGAAQGTK